jgi:hypothetical protein
MAGRGDRQMKKTKWLGLAISTGGLVLVHGCLSSFWQGFWNTGWPTDNRWLNLGLDVANEVIFG